MSIHVSLILQSLINQSCVEVVVLRYLSTVSLVEVLVDIALSCIVVLQLVVSEHSDTVECWVTWLQLDTSLCSANSVSKVTSEVATTYELVQSKLVQLVDVSLNVVLISLLLIVSQHKDMSLECVNILIWALNLHLFQLLCCLSWADLTINHSPLLVTLWVLWVEGDSLVVVACSLTTICTIACLNISQQKVCRCKLILWLASLVRQVGVLTCIGCILLSIEGLGNLQDSLWVLLVLLKGNFS